MPRNKMKPEYDAELTMQMLMDEVVSLYDPSDGHGLSIRQIAEELDMTILKVRKILISAGVFSSEICDRIIELKKEGKEIPEIQKITGLSRASVHSYLPYVKIAYNAREISLNDENFKNAVDELFEDLERDDPEHFAVRQYKKYKLAAGKTAKSILISCGARLAPFDIQELRDLTAYDEMELDRLGEEQTALFVIISDTDDTFNFIVAIMYSQLFNLLCDKADDEHNGRLPVHVRLLLDEFSNIGQIPKFDKLIATIRSREISASIILQSQSQLKTIYRDAAETILGNCDTMLFLGGKESSTLKEISETLGKETIDLYNTSDTRGQSRSYGLNYQKTGKELMSRDELAVMDGSKCILQLRGVRPFLSDKYDITKHRHYKELADYDKKNEFDVEKYLKHELVLPVDQEFESYEYEISEEDMEQA